MAWWDALIDFGTKNADWLAPVAGAAAGALSGSKSQTTTQSSAPVLPENVKAGYDKLIADAMGAYGRPFDARPTKRVETGGNAFQQLFQNPELQMIQQQADAAYQAQPAQQQAQAVQEVTPQAMPQDVREMMVRNSMGGGMSPMYMTTNQQLALNNVDRLKAMDGTTNKYSGEKVNYDDWLNQRIAMNNSGAGKQLFAQANPTYNAALQKAAVSEHAANYDPRDSWAAKLANMAKPFLVGAVLGPGAAGALGGLGVGGTAASLGSKGFSALVNQGLRNA